MAIESDQIVEAVLPEIPSTEVAEIVNTPEMIKVEYTIPEITSALTGD